MSDGEYHARLSPSRAHRYIPCPGSVVLEDGLPDQSSIYADEGTAAHTLATMCLRSPGINTDDFLNENIRVGERSFKVDVDMCRAVQVYVDYVRDRAKGKSLLVEQDVPIGWLTGEEGATGRADAIIIDSATRTIEVVDYKHGAGVVVDPQENFQGMKYALGAIYVHSIATTFDNIAITIVQPRAGGGEPRRWETNAARLGAFVEEVTAAANTVKAAFADQTHPDFAGLYLNPGEKQCRFCKAKSFCPALLAEVVDVTTAGAATADDFASFVPDAVEHDSLGPNFIAVAMGKVGLVEDWCKAVRAEGERMLFSGIEVPGWKLVEGKLGNRAWVDPRKAEDRLKAARLKLDEMYERKLISPTTAEKLLKKDKPKLWADVQKHITRAPGKPSVAPATDPRPAWTSTATAADFSQFTSSE